MNHGIILCLVTAIGFAGWPILSRLSGANIGWTNLVVMTLAAIVATTFYHKGLREATPDTLPIVLLLAAGILNGIGVVAYTKLVTDQQYDLSSYAPASIVLMVILMTLFSAIFFKEALTLTKLAGMVLACTGAWLMLK